MERAFTLDDETRKMYAELNKLEFERQWYPFWIGVGIVTSLLTSLATFVTLLISIASKG